MTPEGIQILGEIFPGREIPAGLKDLLNTIPISRPDLLKASPARLVPPFSLPGLEEMLRLLTEDLRAGLVLTVLPLSLIHI